MASTLTRKVGPLPLWAWLAIGAAGLAAGVYLRRRLSSSSSSTALPVSVPDTTGSTGALGTAGTSGDSGGGVASANPTVPDQSQQEVSDLLGLLNALPYAYLGAGYNFASPQVGGSPPSPTSSTLTTQGPLQNGAPSTIVFPAPTGPSGSSLRTLQVLEGYGSTTTASPEQILSAQQQAQGTLAAITRGVTLGVSSPTPAAQALGRYGVTFGPTAGTRASRNPRQGVYTVH